MSFEYGFFDELVKIAERSPVVMIGTKPPAKEVVGPHSPLTTGAAYRAGLSTGRTQMKKAVKVLKDKAPFYANPVVAAALGAGGVYLGSRLLRSRRDEE